MMVVLKIPIAALIWLVYWAIKQDTNPATSSAPDDGGSQRPHPRPPRRRPPRRGPHAEPPPPSPSRVRTVTARARTLEH